MTRIHWIILWSTSAIVTLVLVVWMSSGTKPVKDQKPTDIVSQSSKPEIEGATNKQNNKQEPVKNLKPNPVKMAGKPWGSSGTTGAVNTDQLKAANIGGVSKSDWKENPLPLIPLSTDQTESVSTQNHSSVYSWNGLSEKVFSRMGNIMFVEWLDNGRKLIVVEGDRKRETSVSVRDVSNNLILWKIWVPNGVSAIAVSLDGKEMAVSSSDNKIALLDTSNGKVRIRLAGHLSDVIQLKYTADASQLVSLGWDRTAAIWDVASGKLIVRTRVHEQPPASFGLLEPDSSSTSNVMRLLICGMNGSKQWWTVKKGQLEPDAQSPPVSYPIPAYPSNDGRYIVVLDKKRHANLFDGLTGKKIGALKILNSKITIDSIIKDKVIKTEQPETIIDRNDYIYTVVFSPDGSLIAGAMLDGRIVIWSTKRQKQIATLKGHKEYVRHLSFTKDNKKLTSAAVNDAVILWDVSKAKEEKRIISGVESSQSTLTNQLSALSADGNIAVLSRLDGGIDVIDLASQRNNHTLKGSAGRVISLSIDNKGERAVAGLEDGSLSIWNLKETTSKVKTIKAATSQISALAISVQRVIAGTLNGELLTVDLSSGEVSQTVQLEKYLATKISINASGTLAAVLFGSKEFHLVRLPSLELVKKLSAPQPPKGEENFIRSIAFSPTENRLAIGDSIGQIDLWDVTESGGTVKLKKTGTATMPKEASIYKYQSSRKYPKDFKPPMPKVRTLRFTHDGQYLLASADHAIVTVGCNNAKVKSILSHSFFATALAVNSTDSRLFALTTTGNIRSWLPAVHMTHQIAAHKGDAKFVIVPPDGKTIITGGKDKVIRIWDAKTGAAIKTLKGGIGVVTQGSMAPANNILATCGYSSAVELWDIPQQTLITKRYGHGPKILAVALSPDEKRVASAEEKGATLIRSVPGFKKKVTIPNQELPVIRMVWMPDGKSIITSTGDAKKWHLHGYVRIWNTKTGQQIKELDGITGHTPCLMLSPDGKFLVTTSFDQQLRIWDTKTWTMRAQVQHDMHVRGITFLDSGRLIACVRYPNVGFILDTQTGKIRHRFTIPTKLVQDVSAAWNADWFATTGIDGSLHIWRLPGSEVIK